MKRFYFILVLLALSCSSSDDDSSGDDPQGQQQPGDPASSMVISGSNFGGQTITFDDFTGFSIGSRYSMNFESGNDYELNIYMLSEGGFAPGTVKTITTSTEMLNTEVQLYDDINFDYYESVSGTITITKNIAWQTQGGNGSGIYLSGTFEVELEESDSSEAITISGSFTDIVFVLE